MILARAYVFADQVKLSGGDVKRVAPGVGDFYIVLFRAVHRHAHHAGKAAYTVVLVDNEVADGQVGAGAYGFGIGELAFSGPAPGLSEAAAGYLGIRQHGEAQSRVFKAGRQPSGGYDTLSPLGQGNQPIRQGAFYATLTEKLRQQLGPAHVTGQDYNGDPGLEVTGYILRRLCGAAAVTGQLLGVYDSDAPGLRRIAPGSKGIGHVKRPGAQAAHGGVKGYEIVVRL